jgi:hypothetical protein
MKDDIQIVLISLSNILFLLSDSLQKNYIHSRKNLRYIDIRTFHKQKTQMYYIAEVFENNINTQLSHIDICDKYVNKWKLDGNKIPGYLEMYKDN